MSETGSVWLQITAGRGPAECQLAVARLADAIAKEAARSGLACRLLDEVEGEGRGALLSALLVVEGERAHAFARTFEGTVQWIAPSPLRPHHKRKNWFVGVDLLGAPQAAGSRPLDPRDVTFEAMRASGAGGQHVNKTESAVRATHRPTGLVAVAREERSQHRNKALALARIAAMLRTGAAEAEAAREKDRWAAHDQLERGKAVRVFLGPEFRAKR